VLSRPNCLAKMKLVTLVQPYDKKKEYSDLPGGIGWRTSGTVAESSAVLQHV